MVDTPSRTPKSTPVRWGWHWRLIIGTPLLVLGCLAMTAPFVAGKSSPFILGILMLASGLIETAHAFAVRDRRVGNAVFFGSGVSVLAGLLLLAQPNLALGALSLLLGLSFLIDGVGMIIAATRRGDRPGGGMLSDGCINVLLGLLIASQWPVSGLWTIGIYVGCRILASGWSKIRGRDDSSDVPETEAAEQHPDPRLRLPPHPELVKLRETLTRQMKRATQSTATGGRLCFSPSLPSMSAVWTPSGTWSVCSHQPLPWSAMCSLPWYWPGG